MKLTKKGGLFGLSTEMIILIVTLLVVIAGIIATSKGNLFGFLSGL